MFLFLFYWHPVAQWPMDVFDWHFVFDITCLHLHFFCQACDFGKSGWLETAKCIWNRRKCVWNRQCWNQALPSTWFLDVTPVNQRVQKVYQFLTGLVSRLVFKEIGKCLNTPVKHPFSRSQSRSLARPKWWSYGLIGSKAWQKERNCTAATGQLRPHWANQADQVAMSQSWQIKHRQHSMPKRRGVPARLVRPNTPAARSPS